MNAPLAHVCMAWCSIKHREQLYLCVLISHFTHACLAQPILLDLITLTIIGEEYTLHSSIYVLPLM
jgi:hypothetical protein